MIKIVKATRKNGRTGRCTCGNYVREGDYVRYDGKRHALVGCILCELAHLRDELGGAFGCIPKERT